MGLTKPRAHQLQDIDYKQTARALTDTNITLSGGAPATVDGVSLSLHDRVLVTGQTDASENGIYYVTTVGAGSNGTWARSLDANETGELNGGTIIMVTEGTNHADTQWKLTTDDPITIGSTNLNFALNSSAAYGVIAVAGQSSISANSVGDTLTVATGNNIVVTTNAGTETLTIAVSDTITATGNITGGNLIATSGLSLGGTAVTATATELNLLDGVTGLTLGTANEILIVGSDNTSIEGTDILTIDTASNYVGINQTSPEVTLHMTGEGAQTAQIRMEQYNDSADAPDLRTRRYRGTIASPAAVQSGDYLFRSNHEYYNGTSLLVGGAFAFDNTNNAARTQFSVAVDTDGTGADPVGNSGQFKIDGNDGGAITFNNAYKFPTSDGSANQILATDGSGVLSFTGSPTFTGLTVDTNTLYVDSANNRIGIGTTSPAYQVEIENTGNNALLVLDRTDGAACFIEGQATRSAFGSVGATPLALAYNSFAVVTIGANGAITVNPDGDGFTFPTTDGSANQFLQTDGAGNISFVDVSTSSVANGTSNVSVVSSGGNVTVGVAGNEIVEFSTDGLIVTGNILPSANITYNLGSDTARWNELFLAGNTLHVGSLQLKDNGGSFEVFQSDGTTPAQITGNIAAANVIGTVASATTATTAGTVTTAAQPNITSVGTLSSVTVTGNVSAGNVDGTTGAFTTVTGAGSGITSLNADELSSGTVPSGRLSGTYTIDISGSATTAGTVTTAAQPNITSVGTLSGVTVSGNAVIGGDLTVSGNTVYTNVTTFSVQDPIIDLGRGANGTPLGSDDGKDRGTQLYYYSGSEKSAFVGYDNSEGKIVLAKDVSISSEVVTVSSYGNVVVGGLEAATASVTGNVDAGNVNATSISGTLITAAQTNITSVGTLSSLSVTGNITVSGLVDGRDVAADGALAASAVQPGDNVSDLTNDASYIDLTDISVNTAAASGDGSLSYNNTTGVFTFTPADAGLSDYGDSNVATFLSSNFGSNTIVTTGNITAGNVIATIVGDVTGNVSGSAATATSATTAGTVTTAAQPNITSVGTLTSVSVTGNVDAGNVNATIVGDVTGNVTGNVTGEVTGNVSGSAATAGTVTTAAQPNITSVGTLTSITTSGNITATGNININDRQGLYLYDSDSSNYIAIVSPSTVSGNVTFTLPGDAGTADYVLATNGAGTLSWVEQSGGGGSGASSFPNSTVTPVPGSEGNFDLSYNYAQTTQETPFETGGTDPFGVSLGEVYSMMDPAGDIPTPTDLGVLT